MAEQMVVPRLGLTVTEVEIVEWLVEDGARVEQGDPVVNIATDKTETELEAPASGIIKQIGKAEETYALGVVIAEIG
jgi:pyruvate/2-oxoglutarate dehydrogenase complex dihydrolipoamide acyltransferase (E2) component